MLSHQIRHLIVKSRAAGASVPRKLVELAVLFLLKRIGPGYFMIARFWRKDIHLREMLQHHNAKQYSRFINAQNHVNFRKISQHKLPEKALLTLRGLPTPAFVGFFHPERGGDTCGGPLCTSADLHTLLLPYAGKRLCFKRAEGSGGSSFTALDIVSNGPELELHHPISGETLSLAEWALKLESFRGGCLIEEYLVQHQLLAELNPHSVNTLRLIVLRTSKGFETHGAMLRIGRAGSQIDNTSTGGLASPIDLSTGRVKFALDLTVERNVYEFHPDTGVRLQDFAIPYWVQCKEMANTGLAAFPRMNFAGIDIAITATGPSIIELNVDPDRRFAAHLDLPHEKLFPICKPTQT